MSYFSNGKKPLKGARPPPIDTGILSRTSTNPQGEAPMPHDEATVEQDSTTVNAEAVIMAESVLQIEDETPTESWSKARHHEKSQLLAPEMSVLEEEVEKHILAAATEWSMTRTEQHPLSYSKLAEKHRD